jgi:hypothetical protein
VRVHANGALLLYRAKRSAAQELGLADQDLLAAALAYAAAGFPVFPCHPHTKEPAVKRGFYDATTNPATIRRLWSAPDRNIAIPPERSRASGLSMSIPVARTILPGWKPSTASCRTRARFAPEFEDGELGLVDRNRRAKPSVYDPAERARWHAMLIWIARDRGYSPKFPGVNYMKKFGAWPPRGSSPQPIPPSPEVRSWVRSRMIAYAKARGAA